MHKEERIKILVKKIQLLEGVQADKMGISMGKGVKVEKVEVEKVEVEMVEGEKVEVEKRKTRLEKVCHTQPEKDWKLRRPLLAKTSVHPQGICLQGGSDRT